MPAANPARKLLWKRIALAASVLLLGLTAVLAYRRFHVPAAQEELLWYFHGPFPGYHSRTRSVQSALAGLLEEPVPSPETAVEMLDENILPSLDELLAEMRALRVNEIDTRVLHAGYVQAVAAMREDAVALRGIFADPALDVAEKRRRARERLVGVPKHFDGFYQRAVEIWKQNGIKTAAPRRE